MKILVTGANGFIGKNLVVALKRAGETVIGYDVDGSARDLREAATSSDVVFHLAGVNRPETEKEFAVGNVGSLAELTAGLEAAEAKPLIVLSSSAQAALDNPYGRSKLAAERYLETYSKRTGTPAVIYRLPGVFGKWCRPNYNSVVPTFCYNIARGLPITISDPSRSVELIHVDDVVASFMGWLKAKPEGCITAVAQPAFTATLGEIAETIQSFGDARETLRVPDVSDPFTKRLLGTYISFLEPTDFSFPLVRHTDPRGTLAELLKSDTFGQVFISRTKPGITRGNHYHDTKVEKFCVIDGDAVVRFRHVLTDEVLEYRIAGDEFKVLDIPPGYTHHIENVGNREMIVLFWASEVFNPERPDTYYEGV